MVEKMKEVHSLPLQGKVALHKHALNHFLLHIASAQGPCLLVTYRAPVFALCCHPAALPAVYLCFSTRLQCHAGCDCCFRLS